MTILRCTARVPAGARRVLAAAITTATLAISTPAVTAKVCSEQDAMAADAVLDHLDSWARIDQAFSKYGHCDQGYLAEGFSEAVARLLVDRWKSLPHLAALSRRHPGLTTFVVQHVDSTLGSTDLDRIVSLARTACPVGLSDLCDSLAMAADQSLRASDQSDPKASR